MTWNSPFQPLQPTNQNENVNFDNSQGSDDLNFTGSIIDFSALNSDNGLLNNQNTLLLQQQQQQSQQPAMFNTDIPALDDLFSELNSDLNSNVDGEFGAKSEPVNLEDIERILLPQTTTRKSNRNVLCVIITSKICVLL